MSIPQLLNSAYVRAQLLSCVWLFETPWTVAHQNPQPMGFSKQEYCSGLPFPPPGDLLNPGIEPMSPASPALSDRFLTTEPPGKPIRLWHCSKKQTKIHLNECGQIPIKLFIRTLQWKSHLIFTWHEISFFWFLNHFQMWKLLLVQGPPKTRCQTANDHWLKSHRCLTLICVKVKSCQMNLCSMHCLTWKSCFAETKLEDFHTSVRTNTCYLLKPSGVGVPVRICKFSLICWVYAFFSVKIHNQFFSKGYKRRS